MMTSGLRSLLMNTGVRGAPMRRHTSRRSRRTQRLPSPKTEHVRIFVTVGTELPFDRLVSAVDAWAFSAGRHDEVFAQIGPSSRPPAHVGWTRFVDGPQFHELLCNADLVVAHAGMGTILSALQYQRPLIVVPRRASLGEHRSDHQLATVERLSSLGWVEAVNDEAALVRRLDSCQVETRAAIGEYGDPSLLKAIRDCIALPDS